MKKCIKCNQTKQIEEFNKKTKGTTQPYCKPCDREHSRNYYKENSIKMKKQIYKARKIKIQEFREFKIKYLLNHPCIDCGEKDIVVLDFDHIEDDKEFNISRAANTGFSMDRILKEMNKCEVRCSNCHRRRTFWARQDSPVAKLVAALVC